MQITLRERLTAARTYFVRTDGNDANTGLVNNAGGAFRTINRAIAVVLGTLDLAGFDVTIQVAAGTYAENVIGASPQVGAGVISIVGDTANPANCVIAGPGASFVARGLFRPTLRGFRLQPGAGLFGLACDGAGSKIRFADIDFAGAPNFHVYCFEAGQIEAIGNYRISTGANKFVLATDTGSYFVSFGRTVTIVGTPALGIFAHVEALGGCQFGGCTFVGGSTGYRYYASKNGVLHTYGASATYLPGNVAGATDTGGLYV